MNARAIAEMLAKKAINRIKHTLENDQQVIAAFRMGMNNAIYDHPEGKFYQRTGNLKRAVKYKRLVSNSTEFRARVYVDGRSLAAMKNLPRHRGDYSRSTAFSPTGTVSGEGYFPFSRTHVLNFIINDLAKQGFLS